MNEWTQLALFVAVMTLGTGSGPWFSRPRLGVVLLLTTLLMLAGCATPSIIMRHPDGRTAQCGDSYSWGYAGNFSSQDRDRGCVYDYQRQGFERAPR